MADRSTDDSGGAAGYNTLRKFARLLAIYARLDLLWLTRNLSTCVVWIVTDFIVSMGSIAGILLLAARFEGIGRWSHTHVLFLLGYVTMVSGWQELFFGSNIAHISRRVGRGQVDHQLVQPQPLWMGLATEGFAPVSMPATLLAGMGMLAWSASALRLTHSAAWFLALMVNLAASITVAMSFQFLWGSLAFWAPRGAEEINTSTYELVAQLKQFPLDGVGPALSVALSSALPIAFLGWRPCRYLVGLDPRPIAAWETPMAACVFAALAFIAFTAGLRHYERVGSQRYSGFGFRS